MPDLAKMHFIATAMTRFVVAVVVCFVLSSCVAIATKQDQASNAPDRLLMQKAQQLSLLIGRGEMSRAAAADELGRFSVRLVGHNVVDDDVFALYRLIAIKRDAGVLDAAKAQQLMRQRLQSWLQRWPKLKPKPLQPAFTTFMLTLYEMDRLGQ